MGEGAAQAYQWTPGSQVNIYGSNFSISGIVRSPGISFSSIWMPLTQGLALFGNERGYQALFVQAAPGADAEALKRELEQHPLITGKYSVFFEDTYSRRVNQLMRDLNSLIKIGSFLALFGVTLGTYTSTNLSLVERSRELGILRSMGFSNQRLMRIFSLRAVMLDWAGFLIGLGCALLYIALQNSSNPLFVLGYHLRFKPIGLYSPPDSRSPPGWPCLAQPCRRFIYLVYPSSSSCGRSTHERVLAWVA